MLNGILEDREGVMRNMDHKESARKLINAMCALQYYSWKHGTNPRQVAGIKPDLVNNETGIIKTGFK